MTPIEYYEYDLKAFEYFENSNDIIDKEILLKAEEFIADGLSVSKISLYILTFRNFSNWKTFFIKYKNYINPDSELYELLFANYNKEIIQYFFNKYKIEFNLDLLENINFENRNIVFKELEQLNINLRKSLLLAINNCDTANVKFLLKIFGFKDYPNFTLEECARSGNLELLKFLVNNYENPQYLDATLTSIIMAINFEYLDNEMINNKLVQYLKIEDYILSFNNSKSKYQDVSATFLINAYIRNDSNRIDYLLNNFIFDIESIERFVEYLVKNYSDIEKILDKLSLKYPINNFEILFVNNIYQNKKKSLTKLSKNNIDNLVNSIRINPNTFWTIDISYQSNEEILLHAAKVIDDTSFLEKCFSKRINCINNITLIHILFDKYGLEGLKYSCNKGAKLDFNLKVKLIHKYGYFKKAQYLDIQQLFRNFSLSKKLMNAIVDTYDEKSIALFYYYELPKIIKEDRKIIDKMIEKGILIVDLCNETFKEKDIDILLNILKTLTPKGYKYMIKQSIDFISAAKDIELYNYIKSDLKILEQLKKYDEKLIEYIKPN